MWLPEILTLFRDRLIAELPNSDDSVIASGCWTTDTIKIGVNNESLLIYDGGPHIILYPESFDPEAHPAGGTFINRNVRVGATAYFSNSCSEDHAYQYEMDFLMKLHRSMIAAIDYYDNEYLLVTPSVYTEVTPRRAIAAGQIMIASTVVWEFQPQPSKIANADEVEE